MTVESMIFHLFIANKIIDDLTNCNKTLFQAHAKFMIQIGRKVNQFGYWFKLTNGKKGIAIGILGNHFAAIICFVAAAIFNFRFLNLEFLGRCGLVATTVHTKHPQR